MLPNFLASHITIDSYHPNPFVRDRIDAVETRRLIDAAVHRSQNRMPPPIDSGNKFPFRMSFPNVSAIAYETTDGPDEVDVLDDSNFTSISSSKRGREIDDIEGASKRSVTWTPNLQRPLFAFDKDVITQIYAQRFQAQANRWSNNFAVDKIIVEPASDLIETCLHTDTEHTIIDREIIPVWMDAITVLQAAELITKYFGQPNSSRPLAENFGKVESKFCYNDASHQRETSLAYISLIRAHEVTSPITAEQQAQLIVIIEKRTVKPQTYRARDLEASFFSLLAMCGHRAQQRDEDPTVWRRQSHLLLRIRQIRTYPST